MFAGSGFNPRLGPFTSPSAELLKHGPFLHRCSNCNETRSRGTERERESFSSSSSTSASSSSSSSPSSSSSSSSSSSFEVLFSASKAQSQMARNHNHADLYHTLLALCTNPVVVHPHTGMGFKTFATGGKYFWAMFGRRVYGGSEFDFDLRFDFALNTD